MPDKPLCENKQRGPFWVTRMDPAGVPAGQCTAKRLAQRQEWSRLPRPGCFLSHPKALLLLLLLQLLLLLRCRCCCCCC